MSWVQIVIYVIMNAPKLVGLIGQILDLVKGMPKTEGLSVKSSLEEAIAQHKLDEDESGLKKVCEGIGCAPELK
jgi:hypothetical protein